MRNSPARPNILLIVLDTARADHFSCYGYGRATTPHIDRIAAEGVRYQNAITPAPWTLPSHASMFTGMYPSQHGAYAGHTHLDGRFVTLAEWLAQAGYHTLGISNNSWISTAFGFERGFHTFVQLWQYFQTTTDMADFRRALRSANGTQRWRGVAQVLRKGNPLFNVANGLYGLFLRRRYDDGARRIREELFRWLSSRESSPQPFFVFINYLEPHLAYRPPPPFDVLHAEDRGAAREMLRRDQIRLAWGHIAGLTELSPAELDAFTALYDGGLSYVDHRIGEIYTLLAARRLLDNTVLIITGDHGENIGDHGLMDHQYCLYDTLLRVPLIIRYPRRFPPNHVTDSQVQLVDLFPGIMDILGGDEDDVRAELQGSSLVPDSLRPRPFAVSEYLTPQPTIDALCRRYGAQRAAVLKYDRTLRAIRTDRLKLIVASDGRDELYDLQADPGELENLIDSRPDDAARLRSMLREWERSFDPAAGQGELDVDPAILRRLEDLGYL